MLCFPDEWRGKPLFLPKGGFLRPFCEGMKEPMNLPVKIYYIMMEAVPGEGNEDALDCGGAFINCWVKAENKDAARSIAQKYLEDENWVFVKEEESNLAQRSYYADDPDALECFDEACEFGLSAAFYMWPPENEKLN